MTTAKVSAADGLEGLRRPFPANVVGKLPKQVRKGDTDRGKCAAGSPYCADANPCGGWHARSVHLDYVGHAAVTDRLLTVDPAWSWEPLALDDSGLPLYDDSGGLWIRLTVLGVTRLGYGDGPDPKQRIGDAIRNAAMRFGVALDLWAKGELESSDPNGGGDATTRESAPSASAVALVVSAQDLASQAPECTTVGAVRDLWREAAAGHALDVIVDGPHGRRTLREVLTTRRTEIEGTT